jgi:hypothetical protein
MGKLTFLNPEFSGCSFDSIGDLAFIKELLL